jgi:CheY-like chemotaxis protein
MRLDKSIVILVAEDSAEDFDLIHRALLKKIPGAWLVSVTSAAQGMAYFSGVGDFRDRVRYPIPQLVLCDLKMTNGDGFMLLRWMKLHPMFHKIPVIMMSGVFGPEASYDALREGAAAYVEKDHLIEDSLRFASRVIHVIESL